MSYRPPPPIPVWAFGLAAVVGCWQSHAEWSDGDRVRETAGDAPDGDDGSADRPEVEGDGVEDVDGEDGPSPDAPEDAGCVVPGAPSPLFPGPSERIGVSAVSGGADTDTVRFRWVPAPARCSEETYQLEVDDSCGPGGLADCPFAFPVFRYTGPHPGESYDCVHSARPPAGAWHAWRVRTCCGECCSAWSRPRLFRCGAARSDLDGDGYSDAVIGANRHDRGSTDEGNAFVYRGRPSGLSAYPDVSLDNPTGAPSGYFGASVSTGGDLDGDGYGDLAVGAPWQNAGADREGNVFVFFGGPRPLPAAPSLHLDNPHNHALGLFGMAVAIVRDLTGDGYDDLVVGSPGESVEAAGAGAVYVFPGAPLGDAVEAIRLVSPRPEAAGAFGVSVAGAGDVDGDGFGDLIVGAYREDAGAIDSGAAYLFLGGPDGPGPEPAAALVDPSPSEEAFFGWSVAGDGDFDGDGYADVAVGAHFHDAGVRDTGAVFVHRGGPLGPSTEPDVVLVGPPGVRSWFGHAAAFVGDIDADGYGDLLVGAPGTNAVSVAAAGAAYLYFGGSGGFRGEPRVLVEPAPQESAWFGWAAAGGGDANRDGYADFLVAAPFRSNPESLEGTVRLFLGGPGGPVFPDGDLIDSPDGQERGQFGVATAL